MAKATPVQPLEGLTYRAVTFQPVTTDRRSSVRPRRASRRISQIVGDRASPGRRCGRLAAAIGRQHLVRLVGAPMERGYGPRRYPVEAGRGDVTLERLPRLPFEHYEPLSATVQRAQDSHAAAAGLPRGARGERLRQARGLAGVPRQP